MAQDLQDFAAKWNNYFSHIDAFVTDGEVEAALNTSKHFETRMRTLDAKLKSDAFDGQIIKFRADHSFLSEHELLRNVFKLAIEKIGKMNTAIFKTKIEGILLSKPC